MFYQNDSRMINEPHPLKIPGCSLECPLSNWTHLLDDVTPKDWSAECYRPNPVLDHYYIVGLTGLSSVSDFLLIVIAAIFLWRKFSARCKRYLKGDYERLPQTIVVVPNYGSTNDFGNDSTNETPRGL